MWNETALFVLLLEKYRDEWTRWGVLRYSRRNWAPRSLKRAMWASRNALEPLARRLLGPEYREDWLLEMMKQW